MSVAARLILLSSDRACVTPHGKSRHTRIAVARAWRRAWGTRLGRATRRTPGSSRCHARSAVGSPSPSSSLVWHAEALRGRAAGDGLKERLAPEQREQRHLQEERQLEAPGALRLDREKREQPRGPFAARIGGALPWRPPWRPPVDEGESRARRPRSLRTLATSGTGSTRGAVTITGACMQ